MTDHELLEARAQIARLQRRVERERSARRESEEVAERSLRRLYARQRALDLLTRSAAASNSASDDQAAFTEVMTMLVEEYEWNVGHLLIPARDDPSVLVSSGLWVGKPEDPFFREVRAATVAARFGPGVGVPGRVMVSGPRWENQPENVINSRKALLSQGSVFAFGVMVESVLVAVLEFLSAVPKPEDPDLVELATPLGEQLGRVIERAKARDAEEHHRVELERTVKERTDDLRKARDRAEALARARSALFNTVTHELSTPVHAAQAALEKQPPEVVTATSQLNLLGKRIDALIAVASESAQGTAGKPTVCVLADMVTDASRHDWGVGNRCRCTRTRPTPSEQRRIASMTSPFQPGPHAGGAAPHRGAPMGLPTPPKGWPIAREPPWTLVRSQSTSPTGPLRPSFVAHAGLAQAWALEST